MISGMVLGVNLKRFWARAALVGAVALIPLLSLAAKDFVMPQANPAKTYPAHDQHPMEAVAVAVDPYDLVEKTKIFSVQYSEIGFLPIFVVVTNDSDKPVELTGMKAQLVTVNRAKLSPAGEDDIARRLARPSANTNRYPIPFPTKKVKGGLSKQAMEEIQNAQFSAKAVEPHSTQSGFLFFDVSDMSVPLAGAHFYLTGVRDAKGNEMMYFEIPLEKYLSAPSK
jgi:hypothetical protein